MSLPPVTCEAARSREWRLPWERGQPPFRPFTNILQGAGDVCRALPDSFAMEGFESPLWITRIRTFRKRQLRRPKRQFRGCPDLHRLSDIR